MRTKNSIKNMTVSILLGLIAIVTTFVTQKFFVESLGVELLGLNGLFTNVVAMLSVAELGLASAIVYHLYKPIKNGDKTAVSVLMNFYKKGYRLVALSILVIGLILIPFLPLIIGNYPPGVNVLVVYALFIVNVVASYLLSYKRSILYADQKNYIINAVHLVAIVVMNALQVWVLLATQNYYAFLILRIIFTLVENYVINRIVDSRYELDRSPDPVDKDLRADIFTKIKGLVFHKVGSFVVLGSTSIIISSTLGLTAVGLYSNYLVIQTAITSLFSQISNAIKASVGNLLVDVGGVKSFATFLKLQFANQLLTVVAVSIFLVSSGSFITLWIGSEFVFDLGITAALALSIYLILTRSVFGNFKEAAGIFYEDRFVPIIESVVNIVASLILIHFMGIAGAFIGTALSSLALHAYSYPKYVYKGVLGGTYKEYTLHVLKNLAIAVLAIGLAYGLSSMIHLESGMLQFAADLLIAMAVPMVVFWLIYRKTSEYSYFKILFLKLLKRNRKTES